jgi:hypothetical protein
MEKFSFQLLVFLLYFSISLGNAASLNPNPLAQPSVFSSSSIDDKFLAEQYYLLLKKHPLLSESSQKSPKTRQPNSLNPNNPKHPSTQQSNMGSSPTTDTMTSESPLKTIKSVFTTYVDEQWSDDTLFFLTQKKQSLDEYNHEINFYAQNILEHLAFLNISNNEITDHLVLSNSPSSPSFNTANRDVQFLNEQALPLYDSYETNAFSRFFEKIYRIQTIAYLFGALCIYSFFKWLFNLILFRKFQNF